MKLKKLYEKLTNQKKDCKNKFVSNLKKSYDLIVIQDEQIHNWHKSKMKGWARRIQHSIMGGIISELKKHSETLVIDKYFPSTKLCPNCGRLNNISLNDRIYICACGYIRDRDTHSANNILNEGLRDFYGSRNTMPVEKISDLTGTNVPDKQFSMKQEARI